MRHCPPNNIEKIEINFGNEINLTHRNNYLKLNIIELKKSHKELTHEWSTKENVEWVNTKRQAIDHVVLNINHDIQLNVPLSCKFLISVFEKAKYILELENDWDDEGGLPYSNEVWKTSAKFLIQYYGWLNLNSKGTIHMPQMHHGPNGTIDIAWHEDNIRMFINIDKSKNTGTFYCDAPNEQYSEGQFFLNNIKFHLIPIPYKF